MSAFGWRLRMIRARFVPRSVRKRVGYAAALVCGLATSLASAPLGLAAVVLTLVVRLADVLIALETSRRTMTFSTYFSEGRTFKSDDAGRMESAPARVEATPAQTRDATGSAVLPETEAGSPRPLDSHSSPPSQRT